MATFQTITSRSADAVAPIMQQGDGFIVVSWWQAKSGDGREGRYDYETVATLNDALDLYREYEDGEHQRATAVGIFAVKNGLPIGGRLDPLQVMRLLAETRNAA